MSYTEHIYSLHNFVGEHFAHTYSGARKLIVITANKIISCGVGDIT